MKDIGDRVKTLRLSKRLTQAELAKRVGISQPSLAYIENGRTASLRGTTLEALARELSSTSAFILRGVGSAIDHESEMMLAELSAVFRDLNHDDQETILRIARGMLPEKPVKRATLPSLL